MLAVVWHYWIAVPLAIGSVLILFALVGSYIRKMQALKHPKR
jgi:TRAP-type C4-dicarboxylate transport system permease small subunit